MHGCQHLQCSAGDPPKSTAKKYKKTTYRYEMITNDGVLIENPDPTGHRKIHLYMITRDRLYWHQNIKVTDFKICIRAFPTQPRFGTDVDCNDFHCFVSHAWKPYLTKQPTNVQRVHFRVAHVPITSIRGETPIRPFWVWC